MGLALTLAKVDDATSCTDCGSSEAEGGNDSLYSEPIHDEQCSVDDIRVPTSKLESLAAEGKTSKVQTTKVQHSIRDRQLIRLALAASKLEAGVCKNNCAACERSALTGKLCQEDGNLYCQECWAAWTE